jgi:hypothetical protein
VERPIQKPCGAVVGRLVRHVPGWISVLEPGAHVVKCGSAEAQDPFIAYRDASVDVPEAAIDGQVPGLEVLDLGVDVDVAFPA